VEESQSAEPGWESLGVAGALLSRYQQDQQALLEQLATFLEATLPQHTSVQRTFGVFGPRRTTAINVEISGMRYLLARTKRAGLEAQRTRVVRGVAVRTDPRSVEEWLNEVSAAIAGELERTDDGRAALQRLLQG
jgi:hypothetical protein